MKKHIIYGHLTILGSMITAIIGTIVLDLLTPVVGYPDRLEVIFTTCAFGMGFASLMVAFFYYTNNFGSGDAVE